MSEQVLYFIGNAFRIYIYWRLLDTVSGTAKIRKSLVLLSFFAYFTANSFISVGFHNFTLNILTNLIPLTALSFLYEAKLSSKVFVPVAFYTVNMMADGMMYALSFVTNIRSVFITSGIGTVLFTFLIERIFEYGLRRQQIQEINIPYFLAMIAVSAGSILIGMLTMENYDAKVIAVSFILILFNIMIFYLYEKIQENERTVYEKKILEQAVNAQREELRLMKKSQEKIQFLQHDFKNHLISIEEYAKHQDYHKIIEYVQSAFGFLTVEEKIVSSGNTEADSILNYKLQEIKQSGAEVRCSVMIPDTLKINDFDINIILGNLLNNALEAMERAEEKKFYLHISFEKNILFVHMENTYDGITYPDGDIFHTRKQNQAQHGLGLKSVQAVLEKYNGDMIFRQQDNRFITDVMICDMAVSEK